MLIENFRKWGRSLKAFGSRVLRKISGGKRDEMIGNWKRFNSELMSCSPTLW
jgi:hypothetical protein